MNLMQSSAQNRRRACPTSFMSSVTQAVAHCCRSEGKPHPRTYTPEDVTAANSEAATGGPLGRQSPAIPQQALR